PDRGGARGAVEIGRRRARGRAEARDRARALSPPDRRGSALPSPLSLRGPARARPARVAADRAGGDGHRRGVARSREPRRLPRALRHVHLPAPEADVRSLADSSSLAHRSLIFDELFFLQLGLALRRSAAGREPGTAFSESTRLVPALLRALPFRPTGAQERA